MLLNGGTVDRGTENVLSAPLQWKPYQSIEWYHVWRPGLTYKRVARVCQHQLSFFFYGVIKNSKGRSGGRNSLYNYMIFITIAKEVVMFSSACFSLLP